MASSHTYNTGLPKHLSGEEGDLKSKSAGNGLQTSSITTADSPRAVPTSGLTSYAVPEGIDEKKLIRRIDLRIIPWLCVLYLLSFLDRTAIGNARLYGLTNELKMTPSQFNVASAVFFVPYALFEIPSNILLKKLRPSVWFPIITCLVGICMLSQGLVSSYGGLLVARFFLGVTEAGLFPGCNYLLSGWYRRSEFGIRAAVFFSAATASGAFGGLLAAALSNMDGIGGYSGWRWIFIIIGLVTFSSGVLSLWLCADFPDTAKFLNEEEREFIVTRLQADQKFSAAGEAFKWSNVWKAGVDWKTWIGMLAYAGADGPLYAFSIFTPSIIQQLGYTATRANLISVPIYVFACIVTICVGFYADRKGHRAFINMLFLSIAITGYIILAASRVPGLSYFAIYLAAAGIYPCIPNTIALTSTSIEGAYKRSVVMGAIISFGNLNGTCTSFFYRQQDRPWYTLGHGFVILYLAMGVITSFIYYMGLRSANQARKRGHWDETILSEEQEGTSDHHKEAADQNAKLDKEDTGLFGRYRAVRRRFGEGPGGVYATIQDAKIHKGDAWSGFVYKY